MGEEGQPVTKSELKSELNGLEAKMVSMEERLEAKMVSMEERLEGKMVSMEERLLREIGHALNVAVEQIGSRFGVVDDKYQDLPGRVTKLEADVAELQQRVPPPEPPRKRASRSR